MTKVPVIALSQGAFTLVDREDFGFLNQFHWYYDATTGYARRSRGNKKVYMHREINKTPQNLHTDHINRVKLDNRKSNLRTVTRKQNQRNTKLFKTNTSGYKGVSWAKNMRKWEAYIWKDNKKINLGHFEDIRDAVLSRRRGESLYWEQ